MKPPSKFIRFLMVSNLCFACIVLLIRGEKKDLPQKIYTGFRSLGGIYIKFLQLLVLQTEAFRVLREYDIYEIYDNVAYEPFDIKAYMKAQLGYKARGIELESLEPFAAGSFGQVYKAQFNGKTIVIKALRPSVIQNLNFDLKILGWFSRFIDMFSSDSAVRMRRVYKELGQTTKHEVNYVLEADYASMLYKRYQGHASIVVPYTYRELCTSRIICQDYLGGVPATDLLRMKAQGIDVEAYIRETLGSEASLSEQLIGFGAEMLTSVFVHGSTYGDPHPGNLKFLPGNKVGFVDYGLQAPAPKNTLGFYHLIEQYKKIYSNQPDFQAYSRALLDVFGGDVIRAADSLDDYYSTTSGLLTTITENTGMIMKKENLQIKYFMENNGMLTFFNTVVNKNNRFCLQYELDGPQLMRAAGLFINLAKGLGMRDMVMATTYGRVIENVRHLQLHSAVAPLHPDTALEILASWMDQVAYKNPKLYRQIVSGGFQFV
jgi:hypothetical protein